MACKYYIDNKILSEQEVKDYIGDNYINKEDIKLTTIGDIANILAYSNNKLILPGYFVEYTTPDNSTFQTYEEAKNHVKRLAKDTKNINLENIILPSKKIIHEDEYQMGMFRYFTNEGIYFKNLGEDKEGFPTEESTAKYSFRSKDTITGDTITITKEEYEENKKNSIGVPNKYIEQDSIIEFLEKNRPYEQSKEIIEEWKKVNDIKYNPEEIYSRGQGFYSVIGAYSEVDINLLFQNLLHHIEDNQKAGGEFTISAFTKPIDRNIGHLEGGGGKVKFVIYPKSEDIKWASNTDVYSGSVWDAGEKISKDKKSELLGVSYTKYPALSNVESIQPNLASVVDNLSHYHNELGIALNNNFRLEYDENIPYQTKKLIDNLNTILDQKFGKLNKPEIKKQVSEVKKTWFNPFTDDYEDNENDIKNQINDLENSIKGTLHINETAIPASRYVNPIIFLLNGKLAMKANEVNIDRDDENYLDKNKFIDKGILFGKETIKGQYYFLTQKGIDNIKKNLLTKIKEKDIESFLIQPIQTNETIKESISNVKQRTVKLIDRGFGEFTDLETPQITDISDNGKDERYLENPFKLTYDNSKGRLQIELFKTLKEAEDRKKEVLETIYKNQKDYTSQALINTKIAKLKEVAKKYPLSLIRSEVKPISDFGGNINLFKDDEDLPFQKINKEEETEINLGDLVTEIPEDITEEGEILHSENENRLTNLQVQRLRNIETEFKQLLEGEADNLKRQKLNKRVKIVQNSIKRLQEEIGYNSLIWNQNRYILSAIETLDDQNSNDFKYIQNVLDDSATLANLIEQVHSELNDNQKARLSDLRVNLGKLQVKYNLVSTKVANTYAGDVGIEYTNPEIAKRDIGMFGKLFLSLAEAKNIPEAQIISRWLNYTKNKVNEKVQNLKDKINAIRINNPDWEEKLKTFFDSKGKFIVQHLSSWYEDERKEVKELETVIKNPDSTNLQIALAYEKLRNWYIKNAVYSRSTSGDARYEQELKDFYALNEDTRLNNPAQFDAELFIFEQENSPQAYLDYIRDIKIDPKHYHAGVHKRVGYRHLLVKPNNSFENPAFKNIENDEVYQLIRDIIIETQSLIPRKTTFDTGNFDKVLNEFTLDMSQDPFTMKGLLNGLGRSFSEYFTPAKDNAEVNFHAVDSKGNDISFILSPDIEKFKKSSPEDLFDVLTKFYEMGVVYDNNTKLLPILQLYSDKLAERPVIKLNKFGNPVYSPKRDPSTGKVLRDEKGKVIRNENPDVITGENSNIRDLVLFTIRSQIFGETKSDEDSTLAFWGDKLINYTRLLGIGLKPFSAVNNYIIGKLNNYAWAANGKDFNDSDLTKAQGVIYGNIMRAFNIEKSITPEAKKLALLLKKFNILGENISKFEGDTQNKFTDIMYFLMTSGEYLIHSEGFIAKMFNTKINKLDGTEGNLWDYFKLGEGDNITYNTKEYGDLKTWEEINPNSDINNWLYQYKEYRNATQGDYANPLYANQNVWGRAITVFRRWLPQAAYQRFGRETDDKSFKGRFLSIGEINTFFKEKGDNKPVALIKTIARMVGEATYISAGIRKFKGENFEENYKKLGLNTVDINNMQVNIRELRLAAWSLAIIFALGVAGDGDDKDLAFASNLASRVYMDLTFWGNPNSAFGIIRNPIPVISTINRFIDVQNAGYNYLFHHSVDTYQRGVYEGYSKLGIAGINATPGAAAITNTVGVVSQKFSSDSYRHQK
jgi:hypothetical protein